MLARVLLVAAVLAALPGSSGQGNNLGYINVKDFGAKGDGVTDDTAAIQSALNALIATGGNGTVFVPNGNYLIAGTLYIGNPNAPYDHPNPDSIGAILILGGTTGGSTIGGARLIKSGQHAPILCLSGVCSFNSGKFSFTLSGTGNLSHFRVENITFDSIYKNNTDIQNNKPVGIMGNYRLSAFRKVRFINLFRGIDGGGDSYNIYGAGESLYSGVAQDYSAYYDVYLQTAQFGMILTEPNGTGFYHLNCNGEINPNGICIFARGGNMSFYSSGFDSYRSLQTGQGVAVRTGGAYSTQFYGCHVETNNFYYGEDTPGRKSPSGPGDFKTITGIDGTAFFELKKYGTIPGIYLYSGKRLVVRNSLFRYHGAAPSDFVDSHYADILMQGNSYRNNASTTEEDFTPSGIGGSKLPGATVKITD